MAIMGNLQGSETKPTKPAKSPGKANRLMKKRFNKGNKKDSTGVVPDDYDSTPEITLEQAGGVTVHASDECRSSHPENKTNQHPTTTSTAAPHSTDNNGVASVDGFLVTDSWQEVNNKEGRVCSVNNESNKQQITSAVSGESSSDSVFTDPLTPVGFAAEINQCYYSEESVNIEVEVPDATGPFNNAGIINNFKLNQHQVKRESELNKKLSKLGVSKTSQISLEDNLDECFVSEDVLVVDDMSRCRVEDGNKTLETTIESGVESMDDTTEPISSTRRSPYYRPRKIELVATRIAPDVNLLPTGQPDHKRHLSMSDASLTNESNVLRKVASLTLEKSNIESKIRKPKFVPEKLDFKIYEKFEGHMLVNWYLSEIDENHYLKNILQLSDLRLLAAQFCTHLLAAGVLRQIIDKDAELESIFKPVLMYFWAHTEAPVSVPQTPGKLTTVLWPPVSPCPSDVFMSPCSNNEFAPTPDKMPKTNGELAHAQPPLENKIKEYEETIAQLRRELDKYKTLVEIQTLTANAVKDFGSPTKDVTNICNGRNRSRDIPLKKLDNIEASVPTQILPDLVSSASPSNENQRLLINTSEEKLKSDSSVVINGQVNKTNSVPKDLVLKSATELKLSPNKTNNASPISESFSSSTSVSKTSTVVSPKVSPAVEIQPCSEKLAQSSTPNKCLLKNIQLSPESGISGLDTSTSPESSISSLTAPPVRPPIPGLTPSNINVFPSPVLNTVPPPPPMPTMAPPPPPMPSMGIPPPPPPPMPAMGPPPPPMPGMGPPPPPMPGMYPPPPPMPGMCPPPPPMPGMGPPPPPMPGMCPPPPPMPGMGPPPPPMPGMGPPPPPMPGMGPPPPPPMVGGGPPPPPGFGPVPPPPPGSGGPIPFPAPPVGGWNNQRASLRKDPINPPLPMKPLYWTRIVIPANQSLAESPESEKSISGPLWLSLQEAKIENLTEFAEMFSRQVVTRKPTKKKLEEKSKVQAIKILDSKRSQNVGILAQSLHVDFSEIENAIYNFDTSIVSLEALQQIYEARATLEELEQIRCHVSTKPNIPLDKPEQFLFELAEISNFANRISCFMFQTDFEDSISTISSTLANLKSTCEFLINSESLKSVLAIILALGNFMNGGNMTRGQADGFGLEILAKLRDVKSKDNQLTLLHFIVRTYMQQMDDPLSPTITLPIPEPGDIDRAATVNFDDLHKDLEKIQKHLDECEIKSKKVIDESTDENKQPFKDKMTMFLENAKKQLSNEFEDIDECKTKFLSTMQFYHFKPKSGTLETFPPNEFFALWSQFCIDFKDIWKKEQQRLIKEKLKELKKRQEERVSNVTKMKKREGGLKSKIEKLRKNKNL